MVAINEVKFLTLIENLPFDVFVINKEGRYSIINSECKGHWGDVTGKYPEEVVNDLETIKIWKHNNKRAFNGEVIKEQVSFDVNGKRKVFYNIITPIKTNGSIENILGINIDITELEEKKKQLQKSEDILHIISNNINDYISIVDQEFKIEYVNEHAHEKNLGYTREDNLNKKVFKFMEDDKIPEVVKLLKELFKNGEAIEQIKIKDKEGNPIWLEVKGKTFLDENDEKKAVFISRDTTKRLKAELLIKDSEAKYRALFDNSPHALFLLDKNGIILKINSSGKNLFDLKEMKMIGKSFISSEIIPPFYTTQITHLINDLLNGIVVKPLTFELYNNQQELIWIEIHVSLVELENENLIQVIINDITERKTTELKLIESEAKFRKLYENVAGGTFIVNSDFEIVDVNQVTCRMTGYERNQLIGKRCDIICERGIHPKSCLIWEEDKEGFQGMDTIIRNQDGSVTPILKNAKKINLKGETHVIENFQDITEKKKIELELKKLNELKSELLRRISHELKTPLVSIKGYTELLLKEYSKDFDLDFKTHFHGIQEGCMRLETLINDLLKTMRLESGEEILDKNKEDLIFLIKFCMNELSHLAKKRNQKILLHLHEELILKFEKESIYEVITNILSNAIKYTPMDGIIEISSEITENFVIISIKDNGIGFTEEEKNLIFKQFGKIERFGKGLDVVSEGTGLGLYISKKVIEKHGGKMWLESDGKFKGSTFYFSLPLITY